MGREGNPKVRYAAITRDELLGISDTRIHIHVLRQCRKADRNSRELGAAMESTNGIDHLLC